MGKSIYTYYKERLIEIGGNNKCLYLKSVVRRGAYDIGKLFEGRDRKVSEFVEFLWSENKQPLTLIGKGEERAIAENIGLPARSKQPPDTAGLSIDKAEQEYKKYQKQRESDVARIIEGEIAKIKDLKREIEEIERETGRYELFIGYPFVFGSIAHGSSRTMIKAPLLLFPVKIEIPDDGTVEVRLDESQKIQINRALVYSYAQARKISVDKLELELDSLARFPNVKSVIDYLSTAHVKIESTNSKNVYSYARFKEPEPRSELSVRYAAVLARFPISNSIYQDYTLLEKKNLTNDAINELLRTGDKRAAKRIEKAKEEARRRRAKHPELRHTYAVKMLDYAQSEVVRRVDEMGNMVIYGPPGTGKSQTIVNIITDAIAKNKRVLVVSQKKAALDVVYSRLGALSEKAMYITDEAKEKRAFYERCFAAHQRDETESLVDTDALTREYSDLQIRIDVEEKKLEDIHKALSTVRPFGLSLSEMYSSSYMLAKNTTEYATYLKLISERDIMALDYKALSDALFSIKAKDLAKMYYSFAQGKEKNPIIDTMLPDLDIRTLSEVKGLLEDVQKSKKGYFNIAKYPYYRQVLAYYSVLDDESSLTQVVKLAARLERPKRNEKEVRERFIETLDAIEKYVAEYSCLSRVMTRDGTLAVIDNILRGNTAYIRLVFEAIDNYIALRDVSRLLDSLDKNMLTILNFAYTSSRTYQGYLDVIDSLLVLRIYHEVIRYEEECAADLSKMVDFVNITSKIYKLKEAQLSVAYKLVAGKNSKDYRKLYDTAEDAKDYLYQISKEQKLWPIRRTMEVYGRFILSLFPCWLLSPENVSSLLPLTKNLFDIVIFDEASQVFIESTIPTIYRGKNIVVAGDAKQLRPSATFMKRYLGQDPDSLEDYSVQAALEVESLLDLAVARYESANLTYHYRSKRRELIDFSNSAFYASGLHIAPNTVGSRLETPIERRKVAGKWIDRTNPTEAREVAEIVREILFTRKNNESIGIITFNSDQQSLIADELDRLARLDSEFRAALTRERYRLDGGEDASIFIKNLENVQGDERDIIIFSIGYAHNESGKLHVNFGSLSAEGGENRLNVAITRAKEKVIVVTSIEPEELKVETTKNLGPKLLREYLTYARAVSDKDKAHAAAILDALAPADKKPNAIVEGVKPVAEQMKERLEKQGYKVDIGLGNRQSRISLAVYDEESDRYLVGVELDSDAYASSTSSLERDVYKPRFLEARGWTLIRVWSRDWWLSQAKVIKSITTAAERARSEK